MALRTPKSDKPTDEYRPTGPFGWRVYRYQVGSGVFADPRYGPPQKKVERVLFLDTGGDSRVYMPFVETPDLFTRFGDIRTEEDVAKFARSFGHLGSAYFFRPALHRPGTLAERIDLWVKQAGEMAEAIDLWSRITDGRLEQVIEWRQGGVLYHPNVDSAIPIATADGVNPDVFHQWQPGELRAPAQFCLATLINQHLWNSTAPQIGIDETQKYRLYTRPRYLLGAIWLQMAQAYMGENKIKKCAAEDCNGWIIYERSSKTMHDACALRLRQKRFRERHNGEAKARQ